MGVLKRLSLCGVILCAVILLTAACTVHQSGQAPPLTGPSTFAQSVNVTATPDLITQDGQSQSAINVHVFGANGQPMSAIPLRIDMLVNGTLVDYGTLSTKSIVTGTDGRATTVYTAPPAPPPSAQVSSTVTIRATAIGTDTPSSAPFSADIRLVPPGVILPPAETPTPDFAVTPTPVNLNVPATFDASTSCGGAVTNGACGGSSPIASYAWTFGDGSSGAGKTVSHTYVTTGTFNATLTITNQRGIAASKTQPIAVAATGVPAAVFVFSPIAPLVGQTVVFNGDQSTAVPGRQIVSYSWNFGDGATASGAGATHVFTSGTFNVTLTVTDDAGQKGTSQPQLVTVTAGNPIAVLLLSKTGGLSITADASGSTAANPSTIATYTFIWGDGTQEVSNIPLQSHSYPIASGPPTSFTVTLRVTDNFTPPRSGSASQPITVP